jgi:DNA-binding response OmpR family regulator
MKMIMLVDDDPAILNLLTRLFRREKLPVITAYSAPSAMDLLGMINVDLIILDIMMLGADGIELCHELRQNSVTSGTPIIMLSAREDLVTQQDAFDAGANMFVGKSYGCNNLINTALQLLAS